MNTEKIVQAGTINMVTVQEAAENTRARRARRALGTRLPEETAVHEGARS